MTKNEKLGGVARWREWIMRWDSWAIGLICLCVALRWWLVWSGGQFWFPDEKRFWWSGLVVERLGQGLWKESLEPILEWNQHPGFTCLGCLPVAIYWVWEKCRGVSYSEMPFIETVRFSAAVLSLTSVISIALVWVIVRRAGGRRNEALLAMALMAGSSTMFYYSRHVLPYDPSMALALGSLAVGLRQGGWRRMVFSGWLAGAAFMTYYGYWVAVTVVSAAVVMWNADSIKVISQRLIGFGIGALSWVGLFMVGRGVVFGRSFLKGMQSFAVIPLPPLFAEGWSAPWAYLWYAEHGLLVFWLAAVAAILWAAGKRRPVARYGMAWVAMAGAVYLLFILSSVILHKFVVYGRTARQLVPFLCLSGAFAGARFLEIAPSGVGRRLAKLGMIALALQSVWNFRTPLEQWFPDDVKRLVTAEYGNFSQAITVDGPMVKDDRTASGPTSQSSRYVLVNAQYLSRFNGVKTLPRGAVLLQFPHPEEFKPHQYEEFTSTQRDILRRTDISIRLLDTAIEPRLANPQTIP